MKDYYAILEVHPKASEEVIKKAYTVLARKYHPDVTKLDLTVAEQKMRELNEAYSILGNSEKRKHYDAQYFHNSATREDNQRQEFSSQNNQYERDFKELADICIKYIRILDDKIIKDEQHVITNNVLIDGIYSEFNSDIQNKLKKYQDNYGMDEDIKNIFALTMFRFAICFTWSNDFVKAKKCADIAKPWITDPKLKESFNSQYSNIVMSASRQKESTNKNGNTKSSISIPNMLRIIVLVAVVIFAIVSCISDKGSSKKASNNPKPSKTVTTSSNTAKSMPQHIVTGYVNSNPMLNTNGMCQLTIDNSKNAEPVYVRLWSTSPSKPVRAFNIAGHESFTIESLSPGSYELRYKYLTGEPTKGTKSQTFTMDQVNTGDGIQYSVSTITLYKVRNGNFRSESISADDI